MNKRCVRCGEVKPVIEFYPRKGGRFGSRADCKACIKAITNARMEKLRLDADAYEAHLSERRKNASPFNYWKRYQSEEVNAELHRLINSSRSDAIKPIYLSTAWGHIIPNLSLFGFQVLTFFQRINRTLAVRRLFSRRYHASDRGRQRSKDYNNRPDVAAKRKRLAAERRSDPMLRAEMNRKGVEHFKRNKSRIYEYRRQQRAINPDYRIGCNYRTYIYQHLGKKKRETSRFKEIAGCTCAELKAHLESLFKPGMTWSNYGDWECDHVRPLASFDLTDDSQQKIAFHFSNTQPLWAHENRRKHAKEHEQLLATSGTQA